jgi:hypothetical protein
MISLLEEGDYDGVCGDGFEDDKWTGRGPDLVIVI